MVQCQMGNSDLPDSIAYFLAFFSHTRRAAVLATAATKASSAWTAFTPYKRHIYLTTITPFLFPSMTFLFNGYRVTDKLNGLFFKVPQRHMPKPCSGAPLRFCKSSCSQDGDEAKIKFRHEGDAPAPGVYCRCRASLVWDFIAMQSQWPNVLSHFFLPLNTWGLFGLCAAFKRSNLMSQNYHNILGRLQDT